MKKTFAMVCLVSCFLGTGLQAAAADMKCLPSPSLTALVAGNTFDGRLTGYGWGEEDDPSSLSLDFTIVETCTFAADEVEALAAGDIINAGFNVYTVGSVEAENGSIKVIPEEEWLTPMTFTLGDEGVYTAETEEGIVRADIFSFAGNLRADLVYINAEGESLTKAKLLKDIVDGTLDVDNSVPQITFDENGFVIELNFSN